MTTELLAQHWHDIAAIALRRTPGDAASTAGWSCPAPTGTALHSLDPKTPKGTVLALPILDMSASQARQRMDRCICHGGDLNGTFTQQMTHRIQVLVSRDTGQAGGGGTAATGAPLGVDPRRADAGSDKHHPRASWRCGGTGGRSAGRKGELPVKTEGRPEDYLVRLFGLRGSIAVVTGAGRGIGQELALALAHAGATVAVLDRDGQSAAATAESITQAGGQALAIACDVTEERAVTEAFAEVAGKFGRVDVLVNNAGLALRKPTAELPLADWDKVVAVNMTGVFLCCREAARMMAPRRSGSIVNIASIMGLSGGGLYPNISYQATKGAVVNMTRALAVELGPSNVRVNAIAPTWVRTAFIRPLLDDEALVRRMEAMMPLGRLAETSDLVGAALFLASQASAMVTGHTLPVDGGFLAQ